MIEEPILKRKNIKKNNYLTLSMLLIGIMLIGGVYAFFQFSKTGDEKTQLLAGEVYLHYSDSGNIVNLSQIAFPETPEEARGPVDNPRTDNIITFDITGKNETANKDIYYEIKLLYGENNPAKKRFRDQDLRFDLEETIDGVTTRVLSNVSYDTINNTRIWVNTVKSGEEVERTYTLRVWISDDILISDTDPNKTYTTGEYKNSYANVKVMVYGDFEEKKIPFLYNEVETSLASYLLPDDGDARIISGGGGYNEGNPVPDANFKNYVWYSGKLWRIVALNNDGTIKLVTQHNITTIAWGANTTFYHKDTTTNTETKSWMYEWLNEDFLDTLYNKENIIEMEAKWDVTETDATTKPTSPTTIEAPVGLLTAYEYTQSYSKTGSYYTGYLNNGYDWWLLTLSSSSNALFVNYFGHLYNLYPPGSVSFGARPSINLSSNIKTSGGDGSLENPYTIEGDISAPANNVTKLSERVSGEYVNFNGETYRIVSIENDITKITKADYLKSGTTPIAKYFSTSARYGGGTSSDYWDYYLNNDWYNNISTSPINYKGMIVEGNWYLGIYPINKSYKATICTEETINQPIKNCTKLTGTDDYGALVYNGYVGLGRVGEMFTSQIGEGWNDSTFIWTITPYSSSSVRNVYLNDGLDNYSSPSSASYGSRPSINLSSNIVITNGLGTEDSPFEINIGQ